MCLTQNRERKKNHQLGGTANNLKINACFGHIKKNVCTRVTNSMPAGPRRQSKLRKGQTDIRKVGSNGNLEVYMLI